MLVSTLNGLGATPRKTRKITLDPITIEGKVPSPGPSAPAPRKIPWKWIGIGAGVLALGVLAYTAKKKGRRSAFA